jgi:hypothetical protein
MEPVLARPISVGRADLPVMRRSHATSMKDLGADGKLVADQLAHRST